jgi:hypothetical protein
MRPHPPTTNGHQDSSPPPRPPPPSATTEAARAKLFLDKSQLPKILEDFVFDCAKARPADVIAYMAQWANQRSNKALLAKEEESKTSMSREESMGFVPSGVFTSPKRAVLLILLGLDDRDEVLEALDSNVEGRSDALKRHVAHVRNQMKLNNVKAASLAALESDSHTFVVLDVGDVTPSRDFLTMLAIAEGVMFVASCDTIHADLVKRRDGYSYNQVLAANALGVKRAMVLLKGHADVSPPTLTSVINECTTCFTNSGFAAGTVPIIRFTSPSELTSIADQVPFVTRKLPTGFIPVKKCEVTVMALLNDGLSVGESFTAFSKDSFACRIDGIKTVIDKETNKVITQKPFMLKRGEVGAVAIAVMSDSGAATFIGCPFILIRGNKLCAFGNVSNFEDEAGGGDDSSSEDFHVSDDGTEP